MSTASDCVIKHWGTVETAEGTQRIHLTPKDGPDPKCSDCAPKDAHGRPLFFWGLVQPDAPEAAS